MGTPKLCKGKQGESVPEIWEGAIDKAGMRYLFKEIYVLLGTSEGLLQVEFLLVGLCCCLFEDT